MTEPTPPPLPPGLDVGQLRDQAKALKRDLRAGDPRGVERVVAAHPKYRGRPAERVVAERMTLRDAQATLTAEFGFDTWRELVDTVETIHGGKAERWPTDPDRSFTARSLEAAQAFDHGVIGPDEILLALLRPPRPTVVATVLEECGLMHEEVRVAPARRPPSAPERREYVISPAWSTCMGMAKGLALAAGSPEVRDEDALFALLYQGWLDHYLEQLDLTAPEVVARLAARGVACRRSCRPNRRHRAAPWGPVSTFRATSPG